MHVVTRISLERLNRRLSTSIYGASCLITEGACKEAVRIRKGRRAKRPAKDHIYLRHSHLLAEVLYERLLSIFKGASIFSGAKVRKQPILVLRTVHHNMGSIPTWHSPVAGTTKARHLATRDTSIKIIIKPQLLL
ncbi:succinate flavoprotein subunit [Drepanopeziza brunnea f. sp. 'multigermtubi' MB_m1]|uniref:Succinate flavoprotein subunit n=1 Tax=Marssonina brunnea f. sp. multigermtubi (strain MB_m1) TaxID=1072389 RepID=K1XZJ2_MARBU|nr:succinate flavoprotein subunit [Drepanopeziza brunnea f. sp. 'multigermtubi' MB_m1]EKD18234.1 succinate flavoprotein subunit [Drepanopeziza brunnea f. sp. 'multigermtubi' MB_m1]